MSPTTYKQVVLVERPPPDGHISDNTFKTEEVSYADLKPGPKEVLYKSIYLSVDPTQRMWINSKATYMPPVEVGAVMRSAGIGIVVQAGEGSVYKAGDAVWGLLSTCHIISWLREPQKLHRLARVRCSSRYFIGEDRVSACLVYESVDSNSNPEFLPMRSYWISWVPWDQ